MASTPACILLPGLDGTGELLGNLAQHLSVGTSATIIRYQEHQNFERYVAFAESRIPADRRIVLVAESFSGPVAIALLARKRRNYVSAILSTTFARPPHQWAIAISRALPFFDAMPDFMKRQVVRNICLNGCHDADLLAHAETLTLSLGAMTIRSRLAALAQMDQIRSLKTIDVPTLILEARYDRLVGAKHVQVLHHHIPDAKLVTLEGPHFLLQTNPETCAELILDHADL